MKLKDLEVLVARQDITDAATEVIVNAAGSTMQMAGGVAWRIRQKGGLSIEAAARKYAPVGLGKARITSAGNLPSRYVIHAVTMNQDYKTNYDIIRRATAAALRSAQAKHISSLTFCALGCGTGRLPYEAVSKIMAQEVFRYVREVKSPSLRKVVFALRSAAALKIFEKNVLGYLSYMEKKLSEGPFLTVDGIIEYQGGIVLIERSNPPFGWALPGGFVDYGESVERAVVREVKEETSLDFLDAGQFKVYSRPERDERFHTVSVAFFGRGRGKLKACSDAKGARVFKIEKLPQAMAFDHAAIIEDYKRFKRGLAVTLRPGVKP